jgi:putative ABC transport system ATP-binding protein
VIGPSGSGKSTLMTLLAGLQRPTAGHIYVDADDLTALPERELLRVRAERLGVVVQNPTRNLLPFGDAEDNVRFAQRGPRSYRRRGLPDPAGLLRDLGLDHLSGPRADRLSGGERQRLALAVGVAGAPGVLLADEPTSQLDHANRDRVTDMLTLIAERFGTTVIAVTHDPDVAAGLSRTVGIHDGQLTTDTDR